MALLRDGPGYITPGRLHGSLIGFPSYHCALALILTWYALAIPRLFWPLLVVNAVVLLSTPVQGGHHLMDVLAAFPVAALRDFPRAAPARAQSAVKPCHHGKQTPKIHDNAGSTRLFPCHAGTKARTHALRD